MFQKWNIPFFHRPIYFSGSFSDFTQITKHSLTGWVWELLQLAVTVVQTAWHGTQVQCRVRGACQREVSSSPCVAAPPPALAAAVAARLKQLPTMEPSLRSTTAHYIKAKYYNSCRRRKIIARARLKLAASTRVLLLRSELWLVFWRIPVKFRVKSSERLAPACQAVCSAGKPYSPTRNAL